MRIIIFIFLLYGCKVFPQRLITITSNTKVSFYTSNVYVDAVSGNDNNRGTITEPYKTISKINSLNLTGKNVFFKGGQTFTGNLIVTGNGVLSNSILITSYGIGKATISSGNGTGILLQDCEYITVKNIYLQGSGVDSLGATTNNGYGISCLSTSSDTGYYRGIVLDSNSIEGFRWGIDFNVITNLTGWKGYYNPMITNNDIDSCAHTGIWIRSNNNTSLHSIHKNVYLYRNYVHNMYGNILAAPNANFGTGIRINFTDSGTVEYCKVNNAGHSGSEAGYGFPANFEAENSSNITWQHNESSNSRLIVGTGPLPDAAGFDVWDGDCQNMLVRYNYIHDNDGYAIGGGNAGFGVANTGNKAVFNLFVNNNLRGYTGDIQIWAEQTGVVIANNTIYSNQNGGKLLNIYNTTGVVFANNLFVSTGTRAIGTLNNSGTKLLNNTYWVNGDTTALSLTIAGVGTFNTLAALHVAGYERISSSNYGFAGLPTFANPGNNSQFLMSQNVSNQNAYNISGIGLGSFVDMGSYTGSIGTKDFHNNTFVGPSNIGASNN